MKFYEALEVMKRGGEVQHAAKVFKLLHRGIHDVTDESTPTRVVFTPEHWDALEGDAGPEVVAPEAVDDVLHETLGSLDTEPPNEEKPQ